MCPKTIVGSTGVPGTRNSRAPLGLLLKSPDLPTSTRPPITRKGYMKSVSDSIYAEGAAATITNMEKLYAINKSVDLKAAADEIVNARKTYVLGVGLVNAVATNFAYLANMAIDNVVSPSPTK